MTDMIRNNTLRRSAWLTLPVLVLLLAAAAAQAAPDLYDVEVILFSNAPAGGDTELVSQGDGGAMPARTAFPAGDFTELSAGDYQLNNIQGGLAAASGYRVLFHRAWRQLAYDRANAVAYPVRAQAEYGRESVTGTISLIKERYLHLDVDLLMTARSATPAPAAGEPGSRPVFRLAEKRRIKSGELHYFDHPRFGLIARVTPYQAADEQPMPGPPANSVPDDTTGNAQEQEPVLVDDQLTR